MMTTAPEKNVPIAASARYASDVIAAITRQIPDAKVKSAENVKTAENPDAVNRVIAVMTTSAKV